MLITWAVVIGAFVMVGSPLLAKNEEPYQTATIAAGKLPFAAGMQNRFVEARPLDKSGPPGDECPAHKEFVLPSYLKVVIKGRTKTSPAQPIVRIYPTKDFAALGWATELKKLHLLLKRCAPGHNVTGVIGPMPYLPATDSAQMLHASALCLGFKGGKGVRYLTVYGQDFSPITATDVFYTFQGLTSDGRTYVAAEFPVYAATFPKKIPASFNYKIFSMRMKPYMADAVQRLTVPRSTNHIEPNIDQLDVLMRSLSIPISISVQGSVVK